MVPQTTNLKVVWFLEVLHPLIGLSLWVDHQRPSSCVGYNDSIIDREAVGGQPSYVPVSDLDRISEGLGEGEIRRARYLHQLEERE